MGSGGRFHTCISLSSEACRVLIDCGASAMMAIRRFGVDPNEVDAIVLSHLHGDHFAGIPFFMLDARHVSKRAKPLTIAGPPGVKKRVEAAMELLYPGSVNANESFPLGFLELEAGRSSTVAEVEVLPFEVSHPSGAPSYALRLSCEDRVVAFSGDTEWTESLVDAARQADLFICECSHFEPRAPFHLDYRGLVRRKDRLECRRLILTHLGADMLERLDSLDMECAEDGMSLKL